MRRVIYLRVTVAVQTDQEHSIYLIGPIALGLVFQKGMRLTKRTFLRTIS
jgi:hypothetical protein